MFFIKLAKEILRVLYKLKKPLSLIATTKYSRSGILVPAVVASTVTYLMSAFSWLAAPYLFRQSRLTS